jgi:dihydropteroate synthase
LFAERGMLHAINGEMHVVGGDPFELFSRMSERQPIDASHAFYLGYELCKAVTALTLGKNYVQDQPLRWGLLTKGEG